MSDRRIVTLLHGEHQVRADPNHGASAHRWAWAEIDLDAVAHNVGVLRAQSAPAEVWGVVKADGYGHGMVAVGKAAVDAGCEGLCVALTAEGEALRAEGIDQPILVMWEQPASELAVLAANRLTPTVGTVEAIDSLAALRVRNLGVHLKVDTGMHRVGAPPSLAKDLADRIAGHAPWLTLEGIYTHLAVADELGHPYTDRQLAQFDEVLAALPPVEVVHAANSAGAFIQPRARRSFVRAGIGLYGVSPGPQVDAAAAELQPVLSLKARVSFVKRLGAGERLSYGLSHQLPADANVATVPLGYADGVRRGLSNVADVLIGGRRRPIIGSITMDQFMVDCGDDPVDRGDEVVLIGRQGDESIGVGELAGHLDTIGYEIMCGISPRIPRVHVRSSPRPPSALS